MGHLRYWGYYWSASWPRPATRGRDGAKTPPLTRSPGHQQCGIPTWNRCFRSTFAASLPELPFSVCAPVFRPHRFTNCLASRGSTSTPAQVTTTKTLATTNVHQPCAPETRVQTRTHGSVGFDRTGAPCRGGRDTTRSPILGGGPADSFNIFVSHGNNRAEAEPSKQRMVISNEIALRREPRQSASMDGWSQI